QSPQGCLEGTRVDLLADLRAWSRDPDVPRIFWLDGMAGTGKSAIARSFCHMLCKKAARWQLLLPSRRCKIGQSDAHLSHTCHDSCFPGYDFQVRSAGSSK
ncbi:hypothetical protein B0H14DRAFT_2395020, partial [Mycena olivaceomarginata]